MSTVIENRAAAPAHAPGGLSGVTFAGVVKSEWIKLQTLLSTRILLLLTVVATVGVGAVAVLARYTILSELIRQSKDQGTPLTGEGLANPFSGGFALYNLPASGIQFGVLVLGTLAVLFISSEYATGMIRSTVTAVPKRLPAFAAKAVVLAVVSYAITTISAVLTFLIAMPVFGGLGVKLDLSTDGVLFIIFTSGLYVAGVALIGLSLGTLLRSSAGGITVLLALFFVVPTAAAFLSQIPGDFWKHVPQYLPSIAGGSFLAIGHTDGQLDPWAGGLVFLGYVALFVSAALLVLKKRDV